MAELSVPRIFISGASAHVGKFLYTLGLVHEFRRQGISVSICLSGSHLMRAAVLRRLCGRFVRILDQHVLSSHQLLANVYGAGVGADLVLVVGDLGLFDSPHEGNGSGSDAELARLIGASVLLVIDGHGYRESLLPVVDGFVNYMPSIQVGGIVLNRVDPLQKEYFAGLLKARNLPSLVGVVPEVELQEEIPPRGIRADSNKTLVSRHSLISIAAAVRENGDIPRIRQLAERAVSRPVDGFSYNPQARKARIAYSEDSCFGVVYQDNLELLRYHGAELVSFSPLADSSLPEGIGGVYITGGYLGDYADDISRNKSILKAITDFVARGGVLYSEGAGTAFLCEEFEIPLHKRFVTGVGVIPGKAYVSDRQSGFVDSLLIDHSVLGAPGEVLKGFLCGDWVLSEVRPLLRLSRLHFPGRNPEPEGFSPSANSFCTFAYHHFGSCEHIAKALVEASAVC